MEFFIGEATEAHLKYVQEICNSYIESAKQRGTGIAERKPEYVHKKMLEGKAVIALKGDKFAGFTYIETWSHGAYVAHSGLIVNPEYRNVGLAKRIKDVVFAISRKRYPDAKIFGITTSLAVMKLNTDLGYEPVTFSELTQDEEFWNGCKACKNVDILERNQHKMCLCTGLMFDPKEHSKTNPPKKKFDFKSKVKTIERLFRIKKTLFINKVKEPKQ